MIEALEKLLNWIDFLKVMDLHHDLHHSFQEGRNEWMAFLA